VHLVAARLLPGAAPMLGVEVGALDEGWTPLDRFLPRPVVLRLVRAVSRATSDDARVAAFDAFFSDRLLNRELDPRLSKALRIVFDEKGDVAMARLARACGAHTRTLNRLFEQWVGLSPKRFARIVRFQAAMRALPDGRSGAEIAAVLGYTDQAHFIRELRELFGDTPREVVRLASRTR
jgi:AraC-like DNA-binding protein